MRTLTLFTIIFSHGIISAENRDSLNTGFFTESTLVRYNLVDIQTVDSTILVDLKYASNDNFMGKNMYGTLSRCYLIKEVAQKLAYAQQLLTKKQPGYHLLVYDGLRPLGVQKIMWDMVKGTSQQFYVANPEKGSIHNYGAAVDLTIADEKGNALDMGTPFDYFGEKAQPRYESVFSDSSKLADEAFPASIKERIRNDIRRCGLLSEASLKNRLLLRSVMLEATFKSLPNEWWHFDAFDKNEIRRRYSIVR